MATHKKSNKNRSSTKSKLGIFVIVWRFPTYPDSYYVIEQKNQAIKKSMPVNCLALFNGLEFANSYLINLQERFQKTLENGASAKDILFVVEILNQTRWDHVRKVILAEDQMAVINPCESDKTHRCPLVFVDLKQYGDFDKLKEVFFRYPDKHLNVGVINSEKTSSGRTLIFFDPQKFIESLPRPNQS